MRGTHSHSEAEVKIPVEDELWRFANSYWESSSGSTEQ
jgi:hypothetical protein